MKKILFPFETGNPVYREAYVFAVKFARNMNAELILLNAFKIDVDNDITKEKYTRLIRDKWIRAYNELSKFNQYYLEEHARADNEMQIKFDHRFIHGKLKDEIKKIAAEDGVSLMILPLTSDKEVNKKQQEFIQDEVFEQNRVSVLIIPDQGFYRPIKTMVFSTDLKKLHNYQLYLDDIVHYARALDSSIQFVHVSPKQGPGAVEETEAYRMIRQVLEKHKQHTFNPIHGKHVSETLVKYATENEAGLIVVLKKAHPPLDALFHKSISGELVSNSTIPVLFMQEDRE